MNQEVPLEFIESLENLLEEITARRNVFLPTVTDISGDPDLMGITGPAFSHRNRESIHAIQYRNYELVHEIFILLHRLKDGIFGICDQCLECIDIDRLRVQPAAALCINCQSTREMEDPFTTA